MERYAYGFFAAALMLTATASSAEAIHAKGHGPAHAHAHAALHHHHHRHHALQRRADGAASAGDRHATHPAAAHHAAFGAPVWVPPQIQTPYPYDGKLAGDGFLGTGFLDSKVLRAFGIARN